jgi:hypothetical protein
VRAVRAREIECDLHARVARVVDVNVEEDRLDG